MNEKDYAPLTASCVRALNDKLYDRRKGAALDIERMVKDFVTNNQTAQIKKLLKVLGHDFVVSHNPHSRKGGLIGLAATAVALGKDTPLYIVDLVKPILCCFADPDHRVRYYACEALYNVVKVAKGSVLPFFNEIFDALSKLAADPEQNVKSGSELLDRLMKDIVTASTSFNLEAFMPLLRERIYTRNQFARQFVVSWISILDAVPDIDLLRFLPELIDGLFKILADPSPEIRKMCETVLGEFLHNIMQTPNVNFAAMINTLITHAQSTDELLQFTAITWIKEFVNLSGRVLLPFASGILLAILPCLAYDNETRRTTRETARAVNYMLMHLITSEDDLESSPKQSTNSSGEGDNKDIQTIATSDQKLTESCVPADLDVPSLVDVLTRQLLHDSMQTRLAVLRWIYHLHVKIPYKIFKHVEELFPVFLKTLSDPSDEVVLLDLEILAEISSSQAGYNQVVKMDLPSPVWDALKESSLNSYFTKFMVNLLNIFSTDRHLLEDRGSFIIRQLCLLLNAEDIYLAMAEILYHEEDMKFASHMVQTLNTILLTSTELFELRIQLKELKTEESCELFYKLYQTWCHNPVATVSLCLLTQNYKHACDLLHLFGDLEVTVDFLTEIDKLVQLIESPIFTYLRLHLLDVQQNRYLIKSLYGLLMLLPQSEAFRTLQHRLECVPNVQLMPPLEDGIPLDSPIKRPFVKKIDFKSLVDHFQLTQTKHRSAKKAQHLEEVPRN